MKNFFNLIKLFSVVALVTSCAYENDPGLQKKDPNANAAVSDKLKGLPNSEILKVKYKTLNASCKLAVVAQVLANPAQGVPAETPPQVPPVPVKNEGEKTSVDFKAQASVDPELKKDITNAALELVSEERKLNLALELAPMAFNPESLTLTEGKVVYVMKYSPVLNIKKWTYTETLANGDTSSIPSTAAVVVHEQVPFKLVVKTEKKGADTFDHVLSCELKGEIDDKNSDVLGQWLKVDCAGEVPTKAEEKLVYEANCKPK